MDVWITFQKATNVGGFYAEKGLSLYQSYGRGSNVIFQYIHLLRKCIYMKIKGKVIKLTIPYILSRKIGTVVALNCQKCIYSPF